MADRDERNPNYPRSSWDECSGHIWREVESQYSSEWRTEVICTQCGAPGEQERATGSVYWPAT